jgi:hypothetical protein
MEHVRRDSQLKGWETVGRLAVHPKTRKSIVFNYWYYSPDRRFRMENVSNDDWNIYKVAKDGVEYRFFKSAYSLSRAIQIIKYFKGKVKVD